MHEATGSEYVPSPSERVRDQVARYEATGGADGGELGGLPVIIITTTGARSGKARKNPVTRVERDGTYAAIASYAGNPVTRHRQPRHPHRGPGAGRMTG
jgi:F420H(2)-dependent quinone reductase